MSSWSVSKLRHSTKLPKIQWQTGTEDATLGSHRPSRWLIPSFVSLLVTKQYPTMLRDGISPTEQGRIRLLQGMNLKRRLRKVQDMKKLLEVRMEDARTLQNMTMSSRHSGLDLRYLL